MSIDESAGQLFIIELKSQDNLYFTEFNDYLKNLMDEYNIGGFIFFKKNIIDLQQVKKFIYQLQENSKTPLFIAIDEEGSPVTRFSHLLKKTFFSHAALASQNSESITYAEAYRIGVFLRELGFNLNFAPVADILQSEKNTMIGERSFGSDPETVIKHSIAFSNGLTDSGIISCCKHFPGCGDVIDDLHFSRNFSQKNIENLYSTDLKPFIALIENNCRAIMSGHSVYRNISETVTLAGGEKAILPSSFSKIIINGLLRTRLNYKNLIITDSLRMNSVANYFSHKEIANYALNAGNDILLMPRDFKTFYSYIANEFAIEQHNKKLIDDSIRRIAYIKKSLIIDQ